MGRLCENAILFGAALSVVWMAPHRARAGVVDTPLPRFADGKQGGLITLVIGVTKRAPLQTDFVCSNLASTTIDLGVEVFDRSGTRLNNINTGEGAVLDVSPGQTTTFGTSATRAYLETVVIPLPSFPQGAARIIATSDKVRCTTVLLDSSNDPPVSLASLDGGIRPVAGPGFAGAALPRFSNGHTATHAALIPGVIKRSRNQTDFLCTSLAAQTIDLGVEVFGPDGTLQNRVADGNGAVLDVAPGTSVTIGTTGTAALLETTVITMSGVAQGMARVVSTSPDVACTAIVIDPTLAPPSQMTTLVGDPGLPGDVNRDGVVTAADLTGLLPLVFR